MADDSKQCNVRFVGNSECKFVASCARKAYDARGCCPPRKFLYNASMNALELKIPPPLIALVLAILMWLTPALEGSVAIPIRLRIGVTLVLCCLGLGIGMSGVVAFRRARTTTNPVKASSASALVRSGIFRFTRNPMYLGLLLVLFAWAVFLSNPLTALFLPVYVLYINRFQIIPEERVLASLFGADYSAYKEDVRRWF